jgi:hypothetical protein
MRSSRDDSIRFSCQDKEAITLKTWRRTTHILRYQKRLLIRKKAARILLESTCQITLFSKQIMKDYSKK